MTSSALNTNPDNALRSDRSHVFHSWSAQSLISPIVVTKAEGSHFWDESGKKYLDFSSQLVNVNIGHQHPKLVAAIQEQAARICTIAPYHANDARSEAARLIAERAPGDLNMVFFTAGGAEATENALRMARLHTGRHKILTTYRSYHGATGGAIQLTGDPRRWPSEPGLPGIVKFWGPYPYRSAFHSSSDVEESQRALQHLRDTLMVEGPQTVAAIMLESVVGTNGILVPPPGYMAGVREICDEFGIVFIADEVMTGFGKTGGLYDLLVWKTEKDTIYKVTYDGKETPIKIYFMDDFVTLGWSEYATLGRYYPAGWATKEALFCVKKAYDLKSENFRVSYIGHEGRHFADYKLFPKLKGVGSADLEYRGKLTEVSLYSQEGLMKRLQFFINTGNYDSDNGHSIAAYCVIRDLSRVLFGNDFEKDINKWKAIPASKINEAAAKLLAENTKALEKIPNVEKFIK